MNSGEKRALIESYILTLTAAGQLEGGRLAPALRMCCKARSGPTWIRVDAC